MILIYSYIHVGEPAEASYWEDAPESTHSRPSTPGHGTNPRNDRQSPTGKNGLLLVGKWINGENASLGGQLIYTVMTSSDWGIWL